ncbi:hypothetical protein HYH03_014954 [Edaphochlamys debaryana]|uniref:MYND-type domain-containing protein n=1 Tax=Edaphochlamys debaryana TaxID=47281 RepID=A0A835XMR8_9CHLO|nr:hypothetical protein HYH03_014954 [Edaphochlamys debaryana]|eukprot:KAG2486374.1 hypothetical protein HYH03_014954 [Edaphochlamys debaryana]
MPKPRARGRTGSAAASSGASSSGASSFSVSSVLQSIRRLPDWARRLLQQRGKDGSTPRMLDVSELEEVRDKLQTAAEYFKAADGAAAVASVLEEEAVLVGILQLVAYGFRLPLRNGSSQSPIMRLRWQVGNEACSLLCRLVEAELPASAAVAGQQRLVRGLLQTQAPHAAARQLAEAAEAIQSSAGVPSIFLRVAAVECVGLLAAPPSVLLDHARHIFAAAYKACCYEGPPGAALIASGPCARHTGMVLGLAALRELEGGAGGGSGGGGGGAGGEGGAPCACSGGALRGEGLGACLQAMLNAMRLGRLGQTSSVGLPRPLTDARLVLRVGFALVASAGQQGAAAGGAGGSRDPAPPAHLVLLGPRDVAFLGSTAFTDLMGSLSLRWPWRWPWLGLASEAWRLAAALLRREVLGERKGPLKLCGDAASLLLNYSAGHGSDGDGPRCFLAEAPPHVAAALAGGALPFLERLLRRAGDEPQGLEAGVLTHMGRAGTGSFADVIPLLVYGEPLQAAALVATVTKLLRRTQAEALLGGEEPAGNEIGTWVAADLLAAVAHPWRSGDPSPAALSRLALVLSLALPEWLPELSRLVRQAAALDQAAWTEGRRGEGQRQPGKGGDTEPPAALCAYAVALLETAMEAYAAATAAAPEEAPADAEDNSSGGTELDPTATASSSRSAVSDSSGILAWPPQGLAEAEVVGAALGLLERWRPHPPVYADLYHQTGMGAVRLVETRPEEVRGLSASGSAFAWRPEAVRAVAEALRGRGDEGAQAEGEEGAQSWDVIVAVELEAWAASQEHIPELGWAAGVDEKGYILSTIELLVPPAEARRCLGLSYCCRECETAHWRSGHKEACGGGGAVGAGTGA